MGLYFAARTVQTTVFMPCLGVFDSAALRLTVRGTRGPAAAPAIASLGLLRDGCRLIHLPPPAPPAPAADGGFEVHFGGPVRANGYFFVTGDGAPEADPVAWLVESFDGAAWRPVGASTEVVWPRSGHTVPRDLHPTAPFPTPHRRGAVVAVDHRPSLPRVLELGTAWIGTLCTLVCAGAALVSRERWVRPLVVLLFASPVCVYGFAAAWHHCLGRHRIAGVYWAALVSPAIVAVGLAWRERHTVLYFALFFTAHVAARSLSRWVLFGEAWGLRPLLRWIFVDSPSLPVIFLGFIIPVLWYSSLERSRRLILADQQRYDAAWADVLAVPAARDALRELRGLADRLRLRTPGKAPRQHSARRRPDGGRTSSASLGQKLRWVRSFYGDEELDPAGAPAKSLDQLFTQAAALNPILAHKAMGWALASGGCLPCRATGGAGAKAVEYVKAAEVGVGRAVQWARIKSASRAIEKTVRSYKGVI
jgi:hypothetical protein